MNKEQYLNTLKLNLKNMPTQEVEDILQYYEEYFEDAGSENEAEVIEELGNPRALANKLNAEAILENIDNKQEDKNVKSTGKISSLWILIAAVCTSPIWFPVGIALASVIFSLVIAAFAVLGSFGITAVALVVAGIMSVVAGIIAIPAGIADAMIAIGIGIFATGFGCVFLAIVLALIKLLYSGIVGICRLLIRKKGDKNE